MIKRLKLKLTSQFPLFNRTREHNNFNILRWVAHIFRMDVIKTRFTIEQHSLVNRDAKTDFVDGYLQPKLLHAILHTIHALLHYIILSF